MNFFCRSSAGSLSFLSNPLPVILMLVLLVDALFYWLLSVLFKWNFFEPFEWFIVLYFFTVLMFVVFYFDVLHPICFHFVYSMLICHSIQCRCCYGTVFCPSSTCSSRAFPFSLYILISNFVFFNLPNAMTCATRISFVNIL